MTPGGTTSLGTLIVYLTANASQYNRALAAVEVDTAAAMEQAVKSVKYASVAIVGSLALIGAASVREFGKFDEAMVHSLAILGKVTEATRSQMEDTAREIGRHSTNSADRVAGAYQGLASAGLDAKQSIGALATVEKFAVAGQISMNSSVLMLTDSVGALGLASQNAAEYQKNITRVADVLAAGANISQASVEELAQALQGKVAGGLRLVNKSVEEGVAVLGAFAKAGIKGLDASEKMSQVLRDLQISALEQPAIWRQFGLSVYDSAGQMRNFADIVEDLEKVLGPLSSEQKRMTLTMLGFQDRSVSAMQSLLGFSGLIRTYEGQLKQAAGTTQDMADTQLTALNAQFTILINNVKDAMITIGDTLLPVLNTFNVYMTESGKQTNNFAAQVQFLADTIKTGLLVAIGVIGDVIAGWKMIIKAGEVAILVATTGILSIITLVSIGIEKAVGKVIDGLNFIRREYAVLTGDFANFRPIEFKGFDFVQDLRLDMQGMGRAVGEAAEEFGKLMDAGRPSANLMEEFGKQQAKVMGYSKGAAAGITAFNSTLPPLALNLGKTTAAFKGLTPEFIQFQNMTRDPVGQAMADSFKVFDKVLEQGGINLAQYNQAIRDVVSKQNQFIMPVAGLMNNTGDQNIDQFIELSNEEKLLTDSYNRKLKATEDYYNSLGTLTAAQEQARFNIMSEMEANYAAQESVFQNKRMELILGASMSISESLLSMAKDTAGEQSGIYKAMFAVSKAFAIADAIIKIQQGIANAAALPFPYNLGAMATVAAATAGIVSSIMAVGANFEGGGYTGSGPRSGGMDGKGGFLAMMHPQEHVIDEYQSGGGGRGGAAVVQNVNVHNYAGVAVTTQKSDDGKQLDIFLRRAEERLASNIRDGKGPVPRAMQDTYKVGRGKR